MEWEEKEAIKEKYTNGTDFFLFNGPLYPPDTLISLLKAFSAFKKWQQSSLKLVLAGPSGKKTAELKGKLESYKYREDVILLENPTSLTVQELTEATYAPVRPDRPEGELSKHLVALYKEK